MFSRPPSTFKKLYGGRERWRLVKRLHSWEFGKTPFNKSADDPRDEDVAFFYAEEANHDAEDAIFQELYGTSTTTVPPGA